MGMSVGGGGKLSADINVVPLVDITLVLLIIFMVMTPMMQRGYDLNIPEKSNAQLTSAVASDQMVVEMKIIGGQVKILLNTNPIPSVQELEQKLAERLANRSQKIVFFNAHEDLLYEEVIAPMDAIRAAEGIVGLVTTELQ